VSAPEFCAKAGVTVDAARQQIAAYLRIEFTNNSLVPGSPFPIFPATKQYTFGGSAVESGFCSRICFNDPEVSGATSSERRFLTRWFGTYCRTSSKMASIAADVELTQHRAKWGLRVKKPCRL
jgi:hypothetical protein